MSGNIAIDPDKLEQLANDVVTELTDMEKNIRTCMWSWGR